MHLSYSARSSKVWFAAGMSIVLIVTLGFGFASCGGDDDPAPTGGDGTPSEVATIAGCSAEALRVFSEYINYLTYIPPKIAGVREVPASVEYFAADPAVPPVGADSGFYRYYLDVDDDDTNDYLVEGTFMPADTNWDGGLYQGDVMIFRSKIRRTLYISDTTMIACISLRMLSHDTYRLTLANDTWYHGQVACDCAITSLSVSRDMSNHDEDSFVMPYGYLEFRVDSDVGRFNGLVTFPSSGTTATVSGTIGADTYDFTIDLLTFEATY